MGAPQPKPFAEKKNVRYGTSVSSRKDFLFFLKTKRNETKRKERGREGEFYMPRVYLYIYIYIFEIVTLRYVTFCSNFCNSGRATHFGTGSIRPSFRTLDALDQSRIRLDAHVLKRGKKKNF